MASALIASMLIWIWTTSDNVLHATDNLNKVPAEYQEKAKQVNLGSLEDYEKFSYGYKESGDEVEERETSI